MMILIVLFGLLFALGLFFVLAEVFKLPRLASGTERFPCGDKRRDASALGCRRRGCYAGGV